MRHRLGGFGSWKKIRPERREQRKKLRELLAGAGITDVVGVQDLMKRLPAASYAFIRAYLSTDEGVILTNY